MGSRIGFAACVLTLAATACVSPTCALAHKMSVFAAVEGKTIAGEASFRDGSPARNVQVTAFSSAGEKLGETRTNEAGKFSFEPRYRGDHRFVVDAGDGHSAEYTVRGDELPDTLPAGPAKPAAPASINGAVAAAPAAADPPAAKAAEPRVPDEGLRAELTSIQKQLVELRRDLAASEDKTRWRDVLGGIGYIFGLSGVAFYFAGMRRKSAGQSGTPASR